MNYTDALAYLDAHTNFEKKVADVYSPERFDPNRTSELLAARGNPQWNYPAVHIAGSKGKGSVAALVESVLRTAGYRTGLYTSPHLNDFRERMQVGRQLIPPDEFAALVAALAPQADAIPGITYFEIATAVALEWFARREIDIAVVEVGLGGRLDPTNVVQPAVCAITALSLEHTALLGDTLAQIAAEKAGILKPGVTVVSSRQPPAALHVIEEVARERSARVLVGGRDYRYESVASTLDWQDFNFWSRSERESAQTFTIALPGAHQVENAALVVQLIEELQRVGWQISAAELQAGLRTADWPARFEVLSRAPLLVIDAAHNQDSARRLVETWRQLARGRTPVLVFGALQDKDVAGMFHELLPVASHAIMTRADHPRAAVPEELAGLARPFGVPLTCVEPVEVAVEEALRRAGADGAVLIAGSVFVAGAARAWLMSHDVPARDAALMANLGQS